MEIQERLELVAAAVRSLPAPALQVIHLRFYQGLAFPAIAAELGEPLEAVKARTRRALGLLRERLDAKTDGDRRAWARTVRKLRRFGTKGLTAGLRNQQNGSHPTSSPPSVPRDMSHWSEPE